MEEAPNLIKLESSDGRVFEVPKDVACMSTTIMNMLDDIGDADQAIPFPNITGDLLERIIKYLKYHHEHPEPPMDENDYKNLDNISEFDKEFCNVDQKLLYDIVLAANYLDIKPLLNATCKIVAKFIQGKTAEEIRKIYNIKNDFTPEEEEAIRKENEWIEDK